jgi:hypothetical protein
MKTSWMKPLRSLAGKAAATIAAFAVLGGLAAAPALADGRHQSPQRHERAWHGHGRHDWRRVTYHPRYVYAPRYIYAAPRPVYVPPPPVVYRAPSLSFDFRIPLR